MKSVFKKYLWLWEFIGAALILGAGFVAAFISSVVLMIIGCAFIIIGILRVIPLVRTTIDKILKWVYTIEIIINVFAGAALIYLAITGQNPINIFGYLIGGILYLRGVIFFYANTLRKESSDRVSFVAHLIFISLGAYIIGTGGFTVTQLGFVLLVLAILSACFIAFSGYGHYRNYRNEFVAKEITKKLEKEEVKEAPTAEEIIPPVEAPTKEEKQEDQLNA